MSTPRYVTSLHDAVCGDHLVFFQPVLGDQGWGVLNICPRSDSKPSAGTFGEAVAIIEKDSRLQHHTRRYRIIKVVASVSPRKESDWVTEGGERIKGNL